MSSDTGNIVLVLLGGALLRIATGDTFLRYVRGGLRWPLLIAGALLVLLGLVSLWRDNPGRRSAPRADHGHGHDHGRLRIGWLLLVPVFAIFLIAPPALGSYAADRSTAARQPAASDYPPLPAGDLLEMRLDEYEARAVWDEARGLAGRRFSMTGFVTAKPGGGYYVTRLVITCCAADATAARVLVTGPAAGSYPEDTWITVTGVYGGVDRSREDQIGPIAAIKADAVKQVTAPKEPYVT